MLTAIFRHSSLCKGHSFPIRPVIKLDKFMSDEYLQQIRQSIAARLSPQEADAKVNQLKSFRPKISQILELRPKKQGLETFLAVVEENLGDTMNYFTHVRPEQSNILKQLEDLTKELGHLEDTIIPFLLNLPNQIDKDVPISSEMPFEVLETIEPQRSRGFKLLDHVKLSYINFGLHSSIIGPQSKFILADGAKLHLALTRYFSNCLSKQGFIPFVGLDLVKSAVVEACNVKRGRNYLNDPLLVAQGEETESFNNFLHLAGEASLESIAALLCRRDTNPKVLPLRLSAIGSVYKQTLEQCHGIQCVSWTRDDKVQSYQEMDNMVKLFWNCYQDLKIPSRLVKVGAQQLKDNEAIRYEIQVWMPVLSTWKTCGHVSNHLNFTPLRLGKEGHQLVEGFVSDFGLLVASIMENQQKEDGTFDIPEILEEHLVPKSL